MDFETAEKISATIDKVFQILDDAGFEYQMLHDSVEFYHPATDYDPSKGNSLADVYISYLEGVVR